jgi:hypothetical protein
MPCLILDLSDDQNLSVLDVERVNLSLDNTQVNLSYTHTPQVPTTIPVENLPTLALDLHNTPLEYYFTPQPAIFINLPTQEPFIFEQQPSTPVLIDSEKIDINIIVDAHCRTIAYLPLPDYNFFIAGEYIPAYSVIYLEDDGFMYKAGYGIGDYDYLAVRGILLNETYGGDRGQVQISGELFKLEWDWIPEKPIYLADDGSLTQDVPTERVFLEVGKALTSKTMFIDLEEPIVIED